MKGKIVENGEVQRLFVLLGKCADNPQWLTNILMENITEMDEYKLWMTRSQYEFVNNKAGGIREEIENFGADNLKNLSVQQVYSVYRGIQEIKKLVDRTDKSITDGTYDALDIIHQDWRGYLLKIARLLLLEKIKRTDSNGLNEIRRLKSPEDGNTGELAHFIKALSNISEPNKSKENITNFHIANCFKIFSEPVLTELPEKYDGFKYDEFDPPFQNVVRNISQGFFCIFDHVYEQFVRRTGG